MRIGDVVIDNHVDPHLRSPGRFAQKRLEGELAVTISLRSLLQFTYTLPRLRGYNTSIN